jgi:hypothetical protein
VAVRHIRHTTRQAALQAILQAVAEQSLAGRLASANLQTLCKDTVEKVLK